MSKKKVQNPKPVSHSKKEQENERKVINWIFGVLVALGVCYAIYSIVLMS